LLKGFSDTQKKSMKRNEGRYSLNSTLVEKLKNFVDLYEKEKNITKAGQYEILAQSIGGD